MCGIAGWLGRPDPEVGRRMRDALAHRGPDGAGEWRDAEAGVWLGHRRLAIVDLTETGAQPMASPSGRFVIVYNGEVYNFRELRAELEAKGVRFRGASDTEVMLAAIEAWGLDAALERFVGMFAFALWDRTERRLSLVRDRLGVKPLYWARAGAEFAFASELTALRPLPWLDDRPDPAALAAYFRRLAVPAPASAILGARKLRPGAILEWRDGEVRERLWWSVEGAAAAAPFEGGLEQAADELEALIAESCRLRLVADVPVGLFLSGGVDSSTVAALTRAVHDGPVRTFTISFDESSHDEAPHARAVARALGVEHCEQRLSAADALALAPKVAALHDEPFADASSLPTYLLCRSARQGVKVALSGDGGDELFGGYPRYVWAERIGALRARLTPMGAGLAARALRAVPAGLWNGPAAALLGPAYAGNRALAARVRRFSGYLGGEHDAMTSAWADPAEVLDAAPEAAPETRFADLQGPARMMALDQAQHLPDDILTKLDRMSMAVSLEAREPLLDHRIVEFAWRLPSALRFAPRGERGKLALRAVLARRLPPALFERPKSGFGAPLEDWLRGPLRGWARDLLAPARLKQAGLRPAAVAAALAAHEAGEDRLQQLWTALAYMAWRDAWRARA